MDVFFSLLHLCFLLCCRVSEDGVVGGDPFLNLFLFPCVAFVFCGFCLANVVW